MHQMGERGPRLFVPPNDEPVDPNYGPLLLSGWIEGEPMLANRSAVVDVPLGKGRVVLFGFGVQQGAQLNATFKLLFSALYCSVMATKPTA